MSPTLRLEPNDLDFILYDQAVLNAGFESGKSYSLKYQYFKFYLQKGYLIRFFKSLFLYGFLCLFKLFN